MGDKGLQIDKAKIVVEQAVSTLDNRASCRYGHSTSYRILSVSRFADENDIVGAGREIHCYVLAARFFDHCLDESGAIRWFIYRSFCAGMGYEAYVTNNGIFVSL